MKVLQTPRHRSIPKEPKGPQGRDVAELDESSAWCLLEQQPTAHYVTVAARARRLQTEVTTPRLKQYLEEMIARCEQLIEEVGMASERRGQKSGAPI
jgi:hypothetical protein